MRLLSVLLLLSAVALVSGTNEADVRRLFQHFKGQYNKQYSSVDVEEYRFSVFSSNLAEADRLNAINGEVSFGVTKFSDLTLDEFRAQYLNFRPQTGQAAEDRLKWPVDKVVPGVSANVTSYDWRDKRAVTAVRDQGQCGSCWAFSVTEATESAWFLAGNTLPSLSVQQIVDCDVGNGDLGCSGGDPPIAYAYVTKAGGLEAESSYPYTGEDDRCAFDKKKIVASINNFTYSVTPCFDSCTKQNENTLLDYLVSTAPPSICVAADPWLSYTGGIFNVPCSSNYATLNHCVQLVGFGTDSGGKYWRVRNSWNSNWGIGGYIHIRFGKNLCGLADEVTFPVAK